MRFVLCAITAVAGGLRAGERVFIKGWPLRLSPQYIVELELVGLIPEVLDKPTVPSGIDPADATGVHHLGGLSKVDSLVGVIPVNEVVQGQRVVAHKSVEVGDVDVQAAVVFGGQPDRAVAVADQIKGFQWRCLSWLDW